MLKKILAVFLFVFLFFAAAVSTVFYLWDRDATAEIVVPPSSVPVDWKERIRAAGNMPEELDRFAADSTIDGNAADLIFSVESDPALDGYYRIYDAITAGEDLSEGDSTLLRTVAEDSTLDRLVVASTMAEYNTVELARIATPEGTLQLAGGPNLAIVRKAGGALLLRSLVREAAHDTTGALADIAAVFRIGEMLYRQSLFLSGNVIGREIVNAAAVRLAASTALQAGDSTMARTARTLAAWSDRTPNYVPLIEAMATDDSATVGLVRDADVLACWRSMGITRLVALRFRPRYVLLGIPGSARATMEGFEGIADPRVSWVAELGVNSIEEFNGLGPLGRVRLLRAVNSL